MISPACNFFGALRTLTLWASDCQTRLCIVQVKHDPPGPWSTYITGKPVWLRPFLLIEYPLAWVAFALSHWSFLHVLESLGSLSVLVAVIFYFSESGDRLKQKHYQAWQVINTAQHMGGSGGRIDALAELNADDVPLVGVDVSSAFLQGVSAAEGSPVARQLHRRRCSQQQPRRSRPLLRLAQRRQLPRRAIWPRVNLNSADLTDGDFCGARFSSSDFTAANLDGADLGNADLSGLQWQQIKSIRKTNLARCQERSRRIRALGAQERRRAIGIERFVPGRRLASLALYKELSPLNGFRVISSQYGQKPHFDLE